MKFVDSNVLVYYIFENEYSDKAAQLLTQHRDLATSIRVIDEVMFVSIRRLALERLGLRRLDRIKRHITVHGLDFAMDKLWALIDVIEQLGITILQDYAEPRQLLEIMENYKLTPSDAVIASTCRHYGIDTVLTFDEDFKRIPWLRTIP